MSGTTNTHAVSPITSVCDLTYFPAYRHSGKRKVSEIKWVILHDEEAPVRKGSVRFALQSVQEVPAAHRAL